MLIKQAIIWRRGVLLRYRYLNRLIRGRALRIYLRLCLLVFGLGKRGDPVTRGGEKRILIIVIGGLGDCLLFDPLFRRLKQQWPDVRIDVLTGCFEDMWERLDSIDNLIYFRPNRFKSLGKYASLFRTVYRNDYDIAAEGLAMLPMRGTFPILTSLVLEASRAPIRIGRKSVGREALLRPRSLGFIGREEMRARNRSVAGGRNSSGNPYLTHAIDVPSPDQRRCHESAYIFAPLGISFHRQRDEPRLSPAPDREHWARTFIRNGWAAGKDVIVGVSVETTKAIKSWPAEHFAAIIEWGIKDNLKFIMVGLKNSIPVDQIKRFPKSNLLDLVGSTSLGELIAVIQQCDVFLSCDTGSAHIAQACRIPTVVLFGPSNEMEFGPADPDRHTLILPPGNLNCRPCVYGPCVRRKSCINDIRPEVVYAALRRRVRNLPIRPPSEPGAEARRYPRVLCDI